MLPWVSNGLPPPLLSLSYWLLTALLDDVDAVGAGPKLAWLGGADVSKLSPILLEGFELELAIGAAVMTEFDAMLVACVTEELSEEEVELGMEFVVLISVLAGFAALVLVVEVGFVSVVVSALVVVFRVVSEVLIALVCSVACGWVLVDWASVAELEPPAFNTSFPFPQRLVAPSLFRYATMMFCPSMP